MEVAMSAITAGDARKSFFDLIKGVSQKHEIYHISHKSGTAVLMSEEKFESLQEALNLLSDKGFRKGFDRARKEVGQGDTASFEDVFEEPQ
jgi:antitoxin YefM